MNKLHKDIPRMIRSLNIIEQYNNFRQLGAKEDIEYLKKRVNELYDIKDASALVESFIWCAKMINVYLDEIEPEFKAFYLKEERELEANVI
jgi:hypothetical protein